MKRVFDLTLAILGTIATFPVVLVLIVLSTLDTRAPGLYRQIRIGRDGQPFTVAKIRSMRNVNGKISTVTVLNDDRITSFGAQIRRWKLDELPQLWLVIVGKMSLVGPRPDVAGYADELSGQDREILNLRPGITGPASLVFRDEERFLGTFNDPVAANDEVVWPAKILINRAYHQSASLSDDARLILLTLRPDPEQLFKLVTGWDQTLVQLDAVTALRHTNKIDAKTSVTP